MRKTRNIFKKIRDTKGLFHAKMGTIKDSNSVDLTEADDIKKQQEYTEVLYKRDLDNPDKHDGTITYLEPYILESEVRWALGSIIMSIASIIDGILAEQFQVLKDDAVKVLHSMLASLEASAVAPGVENVSFHYNPKERHCQRIFKLSHNSTYFTHSQSNAQNSLSEASRLYILLYVN